MKINRLLSGLLLLLLVSEGLSQTSSISSIEDAPLQKPITLSYTLIPMNELLAEISRQSGVIIGCAKEIDDLKAAVAVKNLPLIEFLDGLAKAFDLSWERSGSDTNSSYHLLKSSQQQLREQKLLAQFLEQRKKEMKTRLEPLIQAAVSYDSWTEAHRDAQKRVKILQNSFSNDSEQMARLGLLINDLWVRDSINYLIGFIGRQLNAEQREKLWQGYSLIADADGKRTGLKLPADWVGAKRPPAEFLKETPNLPNYETAVAFLTYHPTRGMELKLKYSFQTDGSAITIAEKLEFDIQAELKRLKSDEGLQTRMVIEIAKNKRADPRLSSAKIGEQLQWLAENTPFSYIAETNRRVTTSGLTIHDKTVYSALNGHVHQFSVNRSGDLITLGRRNYAYERWTEIPERIVRPFENAHGVPGHADFEAISTFAAQLNLVQMNEIPAFLMTIGNRIPLHTSALALHFWGSLDSSQKQMALSKTGLPYNRLRAAQQERLRNLAPFMFERNGTEQAAIFAEQSVYANYSVQNPGKGAFISRDLDSIRQFLANLPDKADKSINNIYFQTCRLRFFPAPGCDIQFDIRSSWQKTISE